MPVALVTIRLFYENEEKSSRHRLTPANHSTRYLLGSLRTLVRKTDSVLLLNYTMYFLLPGANMQGGEIVQIRLWEALLWRWFITCPQQLTTTQGSGNHVWYPANTPPTTA